MHFSGISCFLLKITWKVEQTKRKYHEKNVWKTLLDMDTKESWKTLNSVLGRAWTLYTHKFLFIHQHIKLDEWKRSKGVIFRSYTWTTKLRSLIYSSSLFTAWKRLPSKAKIYYLLCNIVKTWQLASKIKWILWTGDQTI